MEAPKGSCVQRRRHSAAELSTSISGVKNKESHSWPLSVSHQCNADMIDIFKEMSSKSAIPPSAKTRSFLVLGLAITIGLTLQFCRVSKATAGTMKRGWQQHCSVKRKSKSKESMMIKLFSSRFVNANCIHNVLCRLNSLLKHCLTLAFPCRSFPPFPNKNPEEFLLKR